MTETTTVTVAGVPVTVTADGHELAITVGRFDPSAAAGLLRRHPRTGTSCVGVFIADETGDTAHKPDHRWFFELYPAPPGQAGTLLLCDGCYQAAGGRPHCEDDCPHEDPAHSGLCHRAGAINCGWCGTEGRLHEACRDDAARRLPTAGEADEGQWWLHFPDGQLGPYPSQQAAWDGWHASLPREAAGTSKETTA
jgi:hypothetical protein